MFQNYPNIQKTCRLVQPPQTPLVGRSFKELEDILNNPEKANAILLADPGVGKSAYISGFAQHKPDYLILSVATEQLVDKDAIDKDIAMQKGLTAIVDEVSQLIKDRQQLVILFIDEFHRIPMTSPSAVEVLKPILEKSATVGFRIVAATTYEEYDQWIASNRALDQRFIRISIPELPKPVVLEILKKRAIFHKVDHLIEDDLYEDIYTTAKRILISNAQPRASIDILNTMIGHITKSQTFKNGELVKEFYTSKELNIVEKPLSRQTLNRVIRSAYGIDIDNNISVNDVRDALNTQLLNQEQAIERIMSRLERVFAGFVDNTRPLFSFLSTGSTGVGKTAAAKIISETMNIPLKRFDMSRYSRPEDAVKFADDLAQAAWSAPDAYILVDEVEKSTPEAMNILLQVLDDARLTAANNPNRVISFTGNIINLTTNLASEIYQHEQKFGRINRRIDMENIYRALNKSKAFNSAVLGRLDTVVPFAPLPQETLKLIARRELQRNLDLKITPLRPIHFSDEVINYIVIDKTSNDTERGGARDIIRNVSDYALQPLASYLAQNKEEVPLALYIEGKARNKYHDILDTDNAKIVLSECYAHAELQFIFDIVAKETGKQYYVGNCFVPKHISLNDFTSKLMLYEEGIVHTTFSDDNIVIQLNGSGSSHF